MKILVTGSSGLVGRYVMKSLQPTSSQVVGIDIVRGVDCLDFFRKDTDHFDIAIHCAATIGGRKGIDSSPLSVATNLALDSWFFHWLERTHVPQAVYFSSSAVYPVALQGIRHTWMGSGALREDFVNLKDSSYGKPDGTYGWCKLSGEVLASYSSSRVTVVRPFSGTGEGQSLDYPMPAFIDRAKRQADPFEVWGDGTQVRDWIHISDVVDGALLAMRQGIPGPVNLCTGRGVSFNQLAGMITKAVGYSPRIEYKPDAPRGVQCRVGDPTKMREFFTPKISLEETIDRMLCNTKES